MNGDDGSESVCDSDDGGRDGDFDDVDVDDLINGNMNSEVDDLVNWTMALDFGDGDDDEFDNI